jgi:hypothetical protein
MRLKIILIILIILLILVVAVFAFPKTKCKNPFLVQDYSKERNNQVKVCNDIFYYGNTKIVGKNNFRDLFEYKVSKKYEPTKQYIRIFERKDTTYVAITSIIDFVSWYKTSIGIYKKDLNGFNEVFKLPFKAVSGRYSNIRFVSSDYLNYHDQIEASGDLGYLGCYGCRINWVDYYHWSQKKQTYILANNKHKDEFNKIKVELEEQNQNACLETSGVPGIISELYSTRKNSKGFCDDRAVVPYITSEQASILLKAIKAAEFILDNRNIAGKDIKDIKID